MNHLALNDANVVELSNRKLGLEPFRPASLEEILSYQHSDLVETFSDRHKVSLEEAEEIFTEMKKLLWVLSQHHGERDQYLETGSSPEGFPESIYIYDSMAILDEMWHQFILFTRDYHSFCEQYLGAYLHHLPTVPSENEQADLEYEKDPDEFDRREGIELKQQLSYIGKRLGAQTLKTWYQILPQKYPNKGDTADHHS